MRAAAPDLVVSSFTDLYAKDRVGTREELDGLGLASYVSAVDCPERAAPGRTAFDLLLDDYENLGRIFGVEERAAELSERQRAAVGEAAAAGGDVTGEPTVVWLYSVYNGMPYVAGLPSDENDCQDRSPSCAHRRHSATSARPAGPGHPARLMRR
ncbi:hypothetical protein [Streptomyces sp. DH37]|uniref:hypothetical protein n=1 Tax=Streptomyces sp. DH37 TaxID=3040122 RepID=UPI0024436545|nr:hypothetical protein [Streptomyces sp. DH37]MDG9702027.1 hypothetical protein [Streptomyces sp. DH37]